jgi:DNA-binding response OmpR family regulator
VKPFEIDELLARLRALGRRTFIPLENDISRIGEFTLYRNSHTIVLGDQEVQLTPREFQLLDLFLKNKGAVLTREIIMDRIWGMEAEVTPKTIDATVKLLRKKLSLLAGERQQIHSIRGAGYKFEV